jgi:hypothetical protein
VKSATVVPAGLRNTSPPCAPLGVVAAGATATPIVPPAQLVSMLSPCAGVAVQELLAYAPQA